MKSAQQFTSSNGIHNFMLSLVIPCYNESSRVEIMLQGLAEFDQKWTGQYEVIVVDDGSKDDTSTKTESLLSSKFAQLSSKVTVVRMPVNGGKGSALKKGVELATGDYILTLDADMSTKPTDLLLWEKKDKGVFNDTNCIYIGSRKHEEGKVEALASRRLIGGVFNGIVQICTSLQLRDTQCGFKLYPKNVAKFLFANMQTMGWSHDVELLYQADLTEVKIVEMPVNWVNMPESKVNVLMDSMKMLMGVVTISMRIWCYNTFVLPFKSNENATPAQKSSNFNRAIFNWLSLLLIIAMPAMSFGYAVTGDEHWHFDYGNSIYNYFFNGDTEAQTSTSGIQFYGGIFDFITAFVYNVFHIWDHYTTMHFINALVGAIGIIYAGKLAKLFAGWGAGILTIILLVLSPSWFGHNFANPKDIPFSVGYTAGIYFILSFLAALPRPTARHLLGLILSIGWAMGVRIGGFLLIAYLGLFLIAFDLYTGQLKTALSGKMIKQLAIVSAAGYLIAILFWPYAHLGILSKPLEALKIMSNFFVNIGMLYDGHKILSNQIPWFYIPKYILYTAPIVVLVGAGIGLVVITKYARTNKQLFAFGLFVLFTILFPVAYAIYKKSSLYDGWRHFLFIYPPLVVIAATGWSMLTANANKGFKFAGLGAIVLGLIMPAKFVVANHGYESLYYNEIAGGLKNMYGKYETDYYMLGIKEATEWLIEHEQIHNKRVTIGTTTTFPMVAALYHNNRNQLNKKYYKSYERYADFRQDDVYQEMAKTNPDFKEPLGANVTYVRYYERYSKDWDYFIMFSRFVDAAQLLSGNWPPEEVIHTVKVDGVPIAAVLKRKTKKDLAGFNLMKEKKYQEAKEQFLASLQEYPGNELVWAELARLYEAENKLDSALIACQMVLKKHPTEMNTLQMIGGLYMKQNQPEKAMNTYKEVAKYNPSLAHFFQGYTYAMMGNANAAFSEIDEAINTDPYNDQAYRLGMQIAQQTRNMGKAQEYNEKMQTAFPQQEQQE